MIACLMSAVVSPAVIGPTIFPWIVLAIQLGLLFRLLWLRYNSNQ